MRRVHVLALLALLVAPVAGRAQMVDVSFLYKLSSTTGVIPFHGLNVSYDPYGKETLVVGGGRVHIFNAAGMEVFVFGEDPDVGSISAAAPTADGDFVLLTVTPGGTTSIALANFRGEVKGRIEPRDLPPEIPLPFLPNAIGWAQGNVYLADLGGMRIVVLGMDGSFVRYHDVTKLLDKDDRSRADNGLRGFRVAPNGDVLFTIQPLFRAYVLSPDGVLRGFGVRGSAPGKFNIVAGIARDERGYYYVSDLLKSAVLVFDKDFRWVKEFGFRTNKPGALVAPVDVAAGDGKVFVSQFANRGVSVFSVKPLDAP